MFKQVRHQERVREPKSWLFCVGFQGWKEQRPHLADGVYFGRCRPGGFTRAV